MHPLALVLEVALSVQVLVQMGLFQVLLLIVVLAAAALWVLVADPRDLLRMTAGAWLLQALEVEVLWALLQVPAQSLLPQALEAEALSVLHQLQVSD